MPRRLYCDARILLLILIMVVLFITACSNNTDYAARDTLSAINKNEQANTSESGELKNEENVETEDNMKINIIVGNKTFVATLEDNKTANSFAAMLPMTINMDDVNGNEKYYVLPDTIGNETAQNPGVIHTGDIMCYGNAGLVLFYETFSTSYNYVPIGNIDDIEGLTKALGSGEIQVTFAVQ